MKYSRCHRFEPPTNIGPRLISFAYLQERRSETTERYLWTSEWDKLCLLSEWEWGYSYPNGSVNETLVEWTEGLTEGKERPKNEWSSWMSWMNEEWQTKGKDCVKEWTWGVKTDWMLFMISEETARRKEPKVNDWEWSELLLCKEERTNGVTELPLGSEGEWVTKRTDGLKIKTQSLCFHMKDGRSESETKRLFVNETSHKDT